MKISLPARDTIRLFCLLFVISFPSIVSAAVCGTCPVTPSQTLLRCVAGTWDLRDITVAANHDKEYYATCAAGVLGGPITGNGNINTYSGNGANLVYIKDIDTSPNPDTCFQWFSVTLGTHAITATITPASPQFCPGGSVLLTGNVTGGSGTINYLWAGSGGTTNGMTYSANTAVSHTLQITRNTCVVTASPVSVTASDLSVNITMSPPSGSFCAGGNVTLTANGSAGGSSTGITYAWTAPNSSPVGQVIVGSTAGAYSVTATKGTCTATTAAVMLVNRSVIIDNFTRTNVTCNGGSDGSVIATVSGGEGTTYNFSLNGAAAVLSTSPKTFSGLPMGSYSVVVTDNDGNMCSATSSTVSITQPAAMSLSFSSTSPTTIGGSNGTITAAVTNGTPNYTWAYTKPPSMTVVNGGAAAPTVNIPMLSAGSYNVTVTSSNGCTASGTAIVNPLACPMVINSAVPTQTSCAGTNDGKITVNTTGFATNYTVSWAGQSSGTSPSQTSSSYTIMGLAPGNYNISAKDNINCEKTFASVVVVSNPTPITYNVSVTHGACTGDSNGEIKVTSIAGGTGPYVVSWNSPSNMIASPGPTVTIPGLVSGPYVISVTDSKGCVKPAGSVNVPSLTPTQVSISGDDKFCFDQTTGSLNATPGFVSYSWSPGGGSSSTISINNPGASAVNYTVTATDSNGCKDTEIISVSRLAVVAITLNTSASKTSVTCDSDNDGRIDINKSGGLAPYTYLWTGPSGFSKTTEDIDNLFPGTYNLTITDSKGCKGFFTQNITTPLPISASASPSNATCFGDSNGAASVSATGGSGTYTYKWAPGGATTQSIANLTAGTYTVTVTDQNGCFKVVSAQVQQPNAVVGLIDPASTQICNGLSATLIVSGGTSYAWNNGLGSSATVTVSPTTTTTYTVIVTDAATNNCTDDASVTVTVNPLPVAAIAVSETSGVANNDAKLCEGDAIKLTASGGSTYNWSGGLANPLTLSPNAGTETYVVTVTDTKGCKDTESVVVEINKNPTPKMDFSGASQSAGDFQTIKNISIANCGTLTNCDWTINGNAEAGDCVETKPTFTTDGSKNIKLSVKNSCGCSAEKTDVLEIFKSDQCAIKVFSVNNSLGVACVGTTLPISIDEIPSPSCTISGRVFEVFENGTLLTPGVKFDYAGTNIVFKAPGNYDMKYTISDGGCGCTRSSTRSITVVPAPAIGFAADNLTVGCEGEFLNIKFSGFDAGEKVVVQYSNGSTFTYESSSFEFQLGENATETLTILSVQNSNCSVNVVGQKINISVTPKFKIESKISDCDDDGLTYIYTIKTSGGDASKSIIAVGIPGTQSGNNYIIPNLDPTKSYSFTLSRGGICETIDVEIPMIICNCTFLVGTNNATAYSGCESDVFDITNIFKVDKDFDPVNDTLIYVMHNQNTGLNLGPTVYKVYPYSTTIISNDFPGFVPNITTYRLSVVGIRKAQLKEFDFDDPSSIAGDGANRCLSVVSGVPMTWYAEPNPQLGTQDGGNEICRNAYDFMIFAKDNIQKFLITADIVGVSDGNIKKYGFQDTSFVYFEDNGQDSFNIVLYATKEYFDGETTFSCEGESTFTLYVKEGKGSPELSEIILWPGNILASTADSLTTCFEWGFDNFGQSSGVIGTDKYLFAASDIDFSNTTRTYYVDTYFCDNPDCVTRVFYNADGPNVRQIYKEEETFRYQVKPNPNQGDFTLDLFSDVDGNFDFNIIDITGKKILNKKTSVLKGKNSENFNLNGVEKGIYFIQIINKDRNEYSIDKLVIN